MQARSQLAPPGRPGAAPMLRRPSAPPCRARFGGFGGGGKGAKQAAAPKQQQQQGPKLFGDEKACPCGSGAAYKDCCQRLHKGKLRPAAVTPEMVLRARYSAMALGYAFYLKETSHPDNPALKGSDTDPSTGVAKHCTYEEDMAVTLRSIKLQGLELLSPPSSPPPPPADAGAGDASAAEPSPSGAGASAAVDYAFTYKRVVDGKGARVKGGGPPVRCVQRATFVKSEGQKWLLLDSVDIPEPAPKPSPAAAAAAAP